MDGIAGILAGHSDAPHASALRLKDQLRRARDGRDVTWTDAEAGVVLGYRRVAEAALVGPAAQPTMSVSGRWVVALNGRIYNHLELRRQIDGVRGQGHWRGMTDVETLAEAVDAWGFDPALVHACGAFAVAAWDRKERSLWLARDRLGEKSLYYGWLGNDFVFASELRPISAFDGAHRLSVSPESLALLTSLNYIPAPRSVFQQISKLVPGSRVQLKANERDVRLKQYWTFPPPRADWSDPALPLDAQVREVDAAIRAALRRQIPSGLPIGALLSGGIDSSLVVALLQAESGERVKTFTIGFEGAAADESPHEREVAKHLGTDHYERMMTSAMALSQIPRLPALLDEPLGDSSQIPTLCVLGFARQHVAVAFGGDGGDELFGGYGRYRRLERAWRAVNWIPFALRRAAANVVEARFGDATARLLGPHGAAALRKARYYLPRMAYSDSEKDLYFAMLIQWARTDLVRNLARPSIDEVRHVLDRASSTAFVPYMMETDAFAGLPDDIMVKVDRAAMPHALETRAPLLDPAVVELSSRIPLGGKLDKNTGNIVLRECLTNHVPRALFERPKQGFSVPLDLWLRGPLRDWADALLDKAQLGADGYFNTKLIRTAWGNHLSGRANNGHQPWSVLMFQAWLTNKPLHSCEK